MIYFISLVKQIYIHKKLCVENHPQNKQKTPKLERLNQNLAEKDKPWVIWHSVDKTNDLILTVSHYTLHLQFRVKL